MRQGPYWGKIPEPSGKSCLREHPAQPGAGRAQRAWGWCTAVAGREPPKGKRFCPSPAYLPGWAKSSSGLKRRGVLVCQRPFSRERWRAAAVTPYHCSQAVPRVPGCVFRAPPTHTPGQLPLALRKGSQGRWLRPQALSQGHVLGRRHSPNLVGCRDEPPRRQPITTGSALTPPAHVPGRRSLSPAWHCQPRR